MASQASASVAWRRSERNGGDHLPGTAAVTLAGAAAHARCAHCAHALELGSISAALDINVRRAATMTVYLADMTDPNVYDILIGVLIPYDDVFFGACDRYSSCCRR